MGTAHIIRKVLTWKYKTFNMEIAYIALQLQNICNTVYLRNMVGFRCTIVNTLHKCDNIIIIIIIINVLILCEF
jgi:hypothetical protein